MNVNKLSQWMISNERVPGPKSEKEYKYMLKIIKDGFNQQLKDIREKYNDPYSRKTGYPAISTLSLGDEKRKYDWYILYEDLLPRNSSMKKDFLTILEDRWSEMEEKESKKVEKEYWKMVDKKEKDRLFERKKIDKLSVMQQKFLVETLGNKLPIDTMNVIFKILDPKSKPIKIKF